MKKLMYLTLLVILVTSLASCNSNEDKDSTCQSELEKVKAEIELYQSETNGDNGPARAAQKRTGMVLGDGTLPRTGKFNVCGTLKPNPWPILADYTFQVIKLEDLSVPYDRKLTQLKGVKLKIMNSADGPTLSVEDCAAFDEKKPHVKLLVDATSDMKISLGTQIFGHGSDQPALVGATDARSGITEKYANLGDLIMDMNGGSESAVFYVHFDDTKAGQGQLIVSTDGNGSKLKLGQYCPGYAGGVGLGIPKWDCDFNKNATPPVCP